MRKQSTYRTPALRFKRWSRKAYAAFISIRQSVTIGQLSTGIADRFHKKQVTLHAGLAMQPDSLSGQQEEEQQSPIGSQERPLEIAWLLMALLLALTTSKNACSTNFPYPTYSIMAKAVCIKEIHTAFAIFYSYTKTNTI